MPAVNDPSLILRITPPKLRKSLLVRERLRRVGQSSDETAVLLVEAPAGYGKTSLIAQWRLDWLQRGSAVAWLNLGGTDSPVTLVSGIVVGLRRGLGLAHFGTDAVEAVRRGAGTAAALTSLLAEITETSCPMVIVFDNGERLGKAEAVNVLGYLLHNLPPNLRVVIGTRPPVPAEVLSLLGQGLLRRLTAVDLCFDLPEAIQLLTTRFGQRIDTDLCARLHDVTGGWPLGMQLAADALERSVDPRHTVEEFLKSRDVATEQLFESLLNSLPDGLGDFLTRCSLLSALHPSLCEAVTGEEDAGLSLQRLMFATPLLSAVEEGEWLRLHPLAHEYLHARAGRELSQEEQREIHVRAWHWFAARGYPERAAMHALDAGSRREALELVSMSMSDELSKGHMGTVRECLSRFSEEAIGANPQLRLVALWMRAFSFHPDDAFQLAAAFLDDPAVEDEMRADAMAALATAYALVDRYDEAAHYASMCEAGRGGARARQVLAYLEADRAFNVGQTERARQLLASMASGRVSPLVQIWRDFKTVHSYLWEGRPALAEQVARPQHSRWEAEVGRLGTWAALLGSALAGACWQQDMRSDAKVLLAGRLGVIERGAAYGGASNAYRTLARMAVAEGDESRAFAYLEALAAVGESRGTMRLVATSLAERVRMHAAGKRPGQAATVLADLEAVLERSRTSDLLMPQVQLEFEMAYTYAALAAGDFTCATTHLDRAQALANRLNRGYEAVQALSLQALIAGRSGQSPDALLTEALSRAESGGLVRVFADTLPDLVAIVRALARNGSIGTVRRAFVERVIAAAEPAEAGESPPLSLARCALLTPKEYQVLQLLAGGLPNKRIATELDLSTETVKWHVKKLLVKLNAGGRDHAVDRARMLGLLN